MRRDSESLVAGGAVLGISGLVLSQVLPGQFSGVELARNPMTFPRFLLLLFALGGAVLVVRGLVGGGRVGATAPPVAWRRVLAMLVLAGLYFAAFAQAGFIPATAVFLPVAMVVLGYRRPFAILAVTAGAVVGLWYAFAEVFAVRPPGIGIDDLFRALGGMAG